MTIKLESPKQLAERTGWPEKRIRDLVTAQQIRHVRIRSRIFFPPQALEDFIELNMVEPCPQKPKGHELSPVKTRTTSTSDTGIQKSKDLATSQQALRLAKKLTNSSKIS